MINLHEEIHQLGIKLHMCFGISAVMKH